jgi:anti-anti-sigma factor
VTSDHSIFAIVETGERTVIALHDWRSTRQRCWTGEETAVLQEIRDELDDLIGQHQRKALAIDVTDVDIMPSAVLGLLVGLTSRGVKVELLHPSESFRQTLAVTKLDQLLTVRD